MKVPWRSTTPPSEVVWRPRDGQRILEEGRRRSRWGRAMADVGAGMVGEILDGRRKACVGRWRTREGQGSGGMEHGVLAMAHLVMDGGVLEHGAGRVGGCVL
jgi:hypothetical protein